MKTAVTIDPRFHVCQRRGTRVVASGEFSYVPVAIHGPVDRFSPRAPPISGGRT